MQKPKIGDKVKYTNNQCNGTVITTVGVVADIDNVGVWDSLGNLLYDDTVPDNTELIEAATVTAKVVFFREAYDGDHLVENEYAVLIDGGYLYRCENGSLVSVHDKIISYDVVVE